MGKIRVLIADDHAFYREGVCSMLGTVEEVEVAGVADTGEDTVAMAIKDQPEVILMDIKMPGLSGIEATRRILSQCPTIGILMVTMYEDDDSVFAAMRAGARGYLLKDADRDELVRAVAAVSRGEAIFSPAIAQRLIHYFAALPSRAKEVTGLQPVMWGPSIIGFGSIHYVYETGREGDMPAAGFSPRKANLTFYVGDDFDGAEALYARLGKHKKSVACLYVNKLDDVDLNVLREIIARQYAKGI
jgi:DNA-binding NarL/FixJ family response regulator